jgi:hypothetical protein
MQGKHDVAVAWRYVAGMLNLVRHRHGALRVETRGILCCGLRDLRHPVTHHLMISSALTKIDCGTLMSSALAVIRLTTSSNRVGCLWVANS